LNFTIETYDLSKARDDKEIYLDGNYYKSFFVLNIDGTAQMTFSRQGDLITLGTEINKMTGLEGFDSIYLTNKSQEGKELKIIFGQNLGSDTLEAFSQLSQFGVDVNSTPALKTGELNIDGSQNVGTSLNNESINLITKLDNIITYIDDLENKVDGLQTALDQQLLDNDSIITYIDDLENKVDGLQTALDQQLLDNDSIITQLQAINTNTSA